MADATSPHLMVSIPMISPPILIPSVRLSAAGVQTFTVFGYAGLEIVTATSIERLLSEWIGRAPHSIVPACQKVVGEGVIGFCNAMKKKVNIEYCGEG